jgi:co-chaperonin GroES (HSP10)
MKIKPKGPRFLATKIMDEKGKKNEQVDVPGTAAALDKFMFVKVYNGGETEYKKGQVLIVPSYSDTVANDKREFVIAHESDVVATCE